MAFRLIQESDIGTKAKVDKKEGDEAEENVISSSCNLPEKEVGKIEVRIARYSERQRAILKFKNYQIFHS